jgi:cellulose biosynthesis protein BcsQ
MANQRTNAYKEVEAFMQKVTQAFGTSVFKSTIRQSVACSDAVGIGKNVIEEETTGVAQDYKAFIDELLTVIEG